CCGFCQDGFKGIVYRIAQSVIAPKCLPVHLCLALAEMVTVTLGHLPAYLSAFVPMVIVANGLALIVHTVVHDMEMRMFFILMQYGHILGILDTHLFHVFPCVLFHFLHRELFPILVAPTKDGMPYGIAKLWAQLALGIEVGNDGLGVVIPYACRIQDFRLFTLQ